MTAGNLKKEPLKDKEVKSEMVVGSITDLKATETALPIVLPVTPAIKETVAIPIAPTPQAEKDEYNVEVIVDYDGKVDPFYLSEKDPEYAYRFIRDDQKNLSIKTSNMLLQKGGWQIVPREHLVKLGITDKYISSDNHYRVGDTILARMPKKLFEVKQKDKQTKADAPMSAIERMTKKGDATEGGKDIHASMKGIQTKEQMGNVTWR